MPEVLFTFAALLVFRGVLVVTVLAVQSHIINMARLPLDLTGCGPDAQPLSASDTERIPFVVLFGCHIDPPR